MDFLLGLDEWLLASGGISDCLGAVVGEDTRDFMGEDAAKTDSATPRVTAVYAAGDALGAVGKATFVYLW